MRTCGLRQFPPFGSPSTHGVRVLEPSIENVCLREVDLGVPLADISLRPNPLRVNKHFLLMAQEHERHELTDFQKGEIVEGRKFSSHAEIARNLTIPRRTVSGFLTNYDQRATSDNLHRSSRLRKLSESDIRYLVQRAESDTDVPLKEISINAFPDVSTRTLHRRLLEEGIRKWIAVERTLLTQKRAAKRLKWARAHQHKTRED